MPRRIEALLIAGAMLLPSGSVFAHGGSRVTVTAELTRPASVGEVVDDMYLFSWIDQDEAIASARATIDFYYAAKNPAVFIPGTKPRDLDGTPIAYGVRVHDRANSLAWETSRVPAGSYWIWSIVTEPDSTQQMIHFSPGVVTIAHEGDPIPPAIVLSPPDNPFRWPESLNLDIGYKAFDPDLTGRVRLEAVHASREGGVHVLADDLPAAPQGRFEWDTTGLAEGEWLLRATMTDARGLSFVAFDRHYRLVNHPEDEAEEEAAVGGCSSTRGARFDDLVLWWLMIGGALGLGRRRAPRH